MEMESYISMGRTLFYSHSLRKNTPLFEKGIKQNQDKPMETTNDQDSSDLVGPKKYKLIKIWRNLGKI